MQALPGIEDEAKRVLDASSEQKVTLKLIGGMAIAFRCPSSKREGLRRNYVDIDVIGLEKQSRKIGDFFGSMGYEPRERFNAMNGRKRLIFNDMQNMRRVDVFLDVFEMCHKFDFTKRVQMEPLTLPLADLLATKLQIVQINDKDLRDLTTILLDHGIGSSDGETINGEYLARLCAGDWGLYKTFTLNLPKLKEFVADYNLSASEKETIGGRIGELSDLIEKEPKSLGWKMRARVGEKVAWYELPEADKPVVAGN